MKKRIPILFFALIFFACKKDKNADIPSVQITSPSGLNTYNVFDVINVSAHVSDGSSLKSVYVYLENSQNIQALPPAQVAVTSNSMTFTVPYLLGDIHLASGEYYITVSASNGTNTGYGYQKIYVNAAPTRRVAVYAITNTVGTTQVSKLDSVLHSSAGFSVAGNFISSDVNAYYQQLYIAPLDTGNLNAFTVPAGSPTWNITAGSFGIHYFTNVYNYGDAAYVSLYKGGIGYYNHSGTLQTQIPTDTNYYPIKTFVWSSYLFAEEKNTVSAAENLVLYNQSTGSGVKQVALSGPLVGMYGQDNDDIFVFGNQTTGAPYMLQYKISTNLFYAPVSLPAARLLSVAQIDANTYLLGFANNTIYIYTYNPNGMMAYINGVTASHIRYDGINNVVLVAAGKAVNQYNYTNAALMYSASLADSVLDVQILYNK